MADIKTVWIQTAAPRDGNAGACEAGFYTVSDGVVTMRDEKGKPTGKQQKLGPGEDAHMIAGRMVRAKWLASSGKSNFNRRIDYPSTGI